MLDGFWCPACEGSPSMSRLALGAGGELMLYRCDECHGVLAGHDAVVLAKECFAASHPLMRARPSAHRCRRCALPAKAGAVMCAACSASLLLSCPVCSMKMLVVAVDGIVVDVCRPCEFAFFDPGELERACNSAAALSKAFAGAGRESRLGSLALDIAVQAPLETAEVVCYAASATGEVILHVAATAARAQPADLALPVKAAGQAALGGARATAEGASDAAEAILNVLASIFDGV